MIEVSWQGCRDPRPMINTLNVHLTIQEQSQIDLEQK